MKKLISFLEVLKIKFGKKYMEFYHNYLLKSSYNPKRINSKKSTKGKSLKVAHIATFSKWNSGDIFLPLCVKDSFEDINSNIDWSSLQITFPYSQKHVDLINKTSGLVIGGGGIFLQRRDPNAPHPSSWHWNITKELASKIKVPIAFFAVGYNQFRGQAGLSDKFIEHLKSFSDQIVFVGMRNHGSVQNIKRFLSENVHDKLFFQPCPTTIISKLYPQLFTKSIPVNKRPVVGLNCAFDRPKLRYGDRAEEILQEISEAMLNLSKTCDIVYISHSPKDMDFLPELDKMNVKYNVIDLTLKTPEFIVQTYQKIDLMLGMRGHSQMIPFGCRIPILSIISHEKLKYFLVDIKKEEWGVDVLTSQNLKKEIEEKSLNILSFKSEIVEEIDGIQEELLEVTRKNVERILPHFKQ